MSTIKERRSLWDQKSKQYYNRELNKIYERKFQQNIGGLTNVFSTFLPKETFGQKSPKRNEVQLNQSFLLLNIRTTSHKSISMLS